VAIQGTLQGIATFTQQIRFGWHPSDCATGPWIWSRAPETARLCPPLSTHEETMNKIASLSVIAIASIVGASALAQTTPPVSNPSAPMTADPFYTAQMTSMNWRSTELVGKPVYSRQEERIGEIDELVLNSEGRVVAAVVGVGGFLGMGERKVAIAFPSLKMVRDSQGAGRFSIDLSKETLKAAPEYKMPKTN
jgi:sporulation protein YlmC with PRC-barrel domain